MTAAPYISLFCNHLANVKTPNVNIKIYPQVCLYKVNPNRWLLVNYLSQKG